VQKTVQSKLQSTMGQKPRQSQEMQLLQSTSTQSTQSGQWSFLHLINGDVGASYLVQKVIYQL
jgi:hypothetical protein